MSSSRSDFGGIRRRMVSRIGAGSASRVANGNVPSGAKALPSAVEGPRSPGGAKTAAFFGEAVNLRAYFSAAR